MLVCLSVFESVRIGVYVVRPPKLNIEVSIRRLCCLKPFAPRGVLLTHTYTLSHTHIHTHMAVWSMAIDNCVIFSVGTITDNRRCFLSYCVIVLSDSGRVLLQSTPATRLFSGMLMRAQEHNTIKEHNSRMAYLLAFYMVYCIVDDGICQMCFSLR